MESHLIDAHYDGFPEGRARQRRIEAPRQILDRLRRPRIKSPSTAQAEAGWEHDNFKNRTGLGSDAAACTWPGTVLDEVAVFVKPGVTTRDIDLFAASRIKQHGGKSAFLGYRKYPCNICISVNEQVVHGLAGPRRVELAT